MTPYSTGKAKVITKTDKALRPHFRPGLLRLRLTSGSRCSSHTGPRAGLGTQCPGSVPLPRPWPSSFPQMSIAYSLTPFREARPEHPGRASQPQPHSHTLLPFPIAPVTVSPATRLVYYLSRGPEWKLHAGRHFCQFCLPLNPHCLQLSLKQSSTHTWLNQGISL